MTNETLSRRLKLWGVAFGLPMAAILVAGFLMRPGLHRHLAMASAADTGLRPAPELSGGVAWLNTDKPITMASLKGKIVLLDFWTFCCINCIHIMPDLQKLEEKYPNELVVIGVHTAKFDNEKNTDAIRKAVLRYGIKHPVVNDAEQKIWNSFEVSSWPTQAVIDPEGNFLGSVSGEGNYDIIDKVIAQQIKKHTEKKTLDVRPRTFTLEKREPTPLYFPGKLLADAATDRLYIADSSQHRVVTTTLTGDKVAIAGSGVAGFKDGSFAEAQFNDPQGLATVGSALYVADRKNHAIRKLDFATQRVETVAGTGEQERDGRGRGGPAKERGLNSPWDLLAVGDTLYIAMAGHHQIWTLDTKAGRLAPYAGNGRENIEDGSLAHSEFAQPSGLATDGKTLYVADSEVSAVRAVALTGEKRQVTTIVGKGLFKFGDIDGTGDAVRLQHALGVAFFQGKLLVADTYNSKIKQIDPTSRTSETFAGGGTGADRVFNEPAGVSVAGGKLYVADTNAHRIRVVDLATKAVTTLALKGVEPVMK